MTATLNHQDKRQQQTTIVDVDVMPAPLGVAVRPTPIRKRLFDLAVAIPAALITLPVVCALGALSAIHFRQSPIFTQPRLGRGAATFRFWKIRTLPRFTPDTADKYQLRSIELPKFSRRLRRRHLDELPQLWHVIGGTMSLVGPRPEMPTLSASFDPGFVAHRLSVRPGLTGLWQVSQDSRRLIGETEDWDRHYVDHHNLRLDLWIVYRTVLAMTRLDELESLDQIPRWTGAHVRRAA